MTRARAFLLSLPPPFRCHRRRRAWFIRGPGPTAFAGGKKVALADYKAAESRPVRQLRYRCEPGGPGRVSRAGRRLQGLPHRAWRQGICRRTRNQIAVRDPLLDQHNAGCRDRYRQIQRSGISKCHSSWTTPRWRTSLSGDAVHILHLYTDADTLAIKAYLFSLPRRARPRPRKR